MQDWQSRCVDPFIQATLLGIVTREYLDDLIQLAPFLVLESSIPSSHGWEQ